MVERAAEVQCVRSFGGASSSQLFPHLCAFSRVLCVRRLGRLGAPCGPPEDTPQRIADGTGGDLRARFALRGFQVRSRWSRQVCLRGMLPP